MLEVLKRKTYTGLHEVFITDVEFKPTMECADPPTQKKPCNRTTASLAHLVIRIMHSLFIYRYYNEVLFKYVNILCPAFNSAVSLLCW